MPFPDAFKVFDYTFFSGKPAPTGGLVATSYDGNQYGLIPGTLPVQAHASAWRANPAQPLSYSKANCQAWAETLDPEIPLVADTEPFNGAFASADIARFHRLIADIKAVHPRIKIGCYNSVPTKAGAYNWAIYRNGSPGQNLYTTWEAKNRALRSRPTRSVNKIAFLMDFLVPDVYCELPGTWGQGLNTSWRPAWPAIITRHVSTVVAEARKCGKPVYPAAWFDIHGGSSEGDLWGIRLPDNCIDVLLSVLFATADGMFVWGGRQFAPALSRGGDPVDNGNAAYSTQTSWTSRLANFLA